MKWLLKIYHRVKRTFNAAVNAMVARLGVYTGYYRSARGSRMIVYHGICAKNPLRFNTLFVTRKIFEKHLQFYQKYCRLLSLDDYYQQRFDPDRFNICISFDDGFAGAYRHALPLLEKYQAPAAFFITGIRNTGGDILWNDFLSLIHRNGPAMILFDDKVFYRRKDKYREHETNTTLNDWLRTRSYEEKKAWMTSMQEHAWFREDPSLIDYWLQMEVEEIKRLADSPLISIGSHGYYHNDLVHDDAETLAAELVHSKQFLETVTGKQVNSISFPYGSYSPEVISSAETAGYRQLLAGEFLFDKDGENVLLRERMAINPFIGPAAQLRAIIKGDYS